MFGTVADIGIIGKIWYRELITLTYHTAGIFTLRSFAIYGKNYFIFSVLAVLGTVRVILDVVRHLFSFCFDKKLLTLPAVLMIACDLQVCYIYHFASSIPCTWSVLVVLIFPWLKVSFVWNSY